METFIKEKQFTYNPDFQKHKQAAVKDLDINSLDKSLKKFIERLNRLPFCFTLQCCYGHFIYKGQNDPYNVELIPVSDSIKKVDYKIAYLAFCIQDSLPGRQLLEELRKVPESAKACHYSGQTYIHIFKTAK